MTLQDFLEEDFRKQGFWNQETLENASEDSLDFIRVNAYENFLKEWKNDDMVCNCFTSLCEIRMADSNNPKEIEFFDNLTLDEAIAIAEGKEKSEYYDEVRALTKETANKAYQNCCANLLFIYEECEGGQIEAFKKHFGDDVEFLNLDDETIREAIHYVKEQNLFMLKDYDIGERLADWVHNQAIDFMFAQSKETDLTQLSKPFDLMTETIAICEEKQNKNKVRKQK